MKLNPYIWLPHLKFTLMTMAVLYPVNPNSVSKKNIMILLVIYLYLFL